MAAVLTAAASHAPFYVAGGALAAWAVFVGALGIARPTFVRGDGAGRAVVGGTLLLTLATVATAIATAS